MKSVHSKIFLTACLSLLIGSLFGYFCKNPTDRRMSENRIAVVPVHRMPDFGAGNLAGSEAIIPKSWQIDFGALSLPSGASVPPLSLPALVSAPINIGKMETRETDKDMCVIVQVPGLTVNDINIRVGRDTITITGQKVIGDGDKNDGLQAIKESLEETVKLPCRVDIDKAQATLNNGVLTVSLPKVTHSIAQGVSNSWQ